MPKLSSSLTLVLLHLLVIFTVDCEGGSGKNRTETCKTLYDKGVQSYLANEFEECVYYFEDAIDTYHEYTKKIENCRLKCHEDAELSDPLYNINVENLRFYENIVKNTLCIIKCRNRDSNFFEEYNLEDDTVKIFEDRKPYEYLHICYYQLKHLQKAASAVFTVLVARPNDEAMIRQLKHYTTLPEVNIADIVNFEAKEYVSLYVYGVRAYDSQSWNEVIHNMEESLLSYLQTEEECRAGCEGPYDQGWLPDFIPSIANHFTHALRCKRKCKDKLSTLNGEKHDDLYPSHYHYLQYAYFKGNLRAACEAVASYMLFYPMDETMIFNMDFYRKMPKVKEDFFTPRPEAMKYYHRNAYEETLISFIFTVFTDETYYTAKEMKNLDRGTKTRFVIDNFITPAQCGVLFDVMNGHSIIGDGYHGIPTPHTVHELYGGLSLGTAGELVYKKKLSKKVLGKILKIADKVKQAVIREFDVRRKLHFTFTHLVYRSAKPGAQNNRSDLSHGVHADNCNIQLDGSCPRKSPAFVWRDYTAILYLNDEFAGGELFFSRNHIGDDVEQLVRPKCGRLVGFTSGSENFHGVKAVTNGTRYAMALWFTYDEERYEPERKVLAKYYPM